MPTLEENRHSWGQHYDWSRGGEEWSESWGGEDAQWYGTILPRIQAFITRDGGAPRGGTILEIAPGFGRWTKYLKTFADRLIVVDLNEKCITACRERFKSESHLEYHVNDGKSLAAVEDGSIDFAFSMDSLVHAEVDVFEAYLPQLAAKLTPNGVGFIHHSNLGAVAAELDAQKLNDHWRARTMTGARFKEIAEAAGLKCLSQELINWGTPTALIDGLSVFAKADSRWQVAPEALSNGRFMAEADQRRILAALYGRRRVGAPD